MPTTCCGELGVAVDLARRQARAGEVVLLSPACASWDQFRSFEHRGDVFREMVAAIERNARADGVPTSGAPRGAEGGSAAG